MEHFWVLLLACLPLIRNKATDVVIDVKTRKFQPDMISLRLGEKIRFILRNKDAELHAFVPIGIFLDTTLNVSGNGAPQFGKDGLLRVLLPFHRANRNFVYA